jgi:lambda family phage portal protein
MLHLFRKLRPAQRRGAPYLASVIEAFKQLDKYTEAEVMAAVVSAMFTVFVKTESGTGLGTLEPTAETGAKTSDKDIKLASGAIWDLAKGESIEVANPGRPNQAFDPFVNAILAQIGTALEIPFELLIKRFMSSYSAARAALLEAWKAFRTRRAWLAWNFCQPVYEAVITEAVARGRISAPGFFADPLIRQAWLGCEWTGPPPGQIDPEAEINAAKERVDLGVSTLQRETAEISGADWEALHKQRAREKRMRVADGLEADASPGESPTPAAPPRDTPARRERTISRAT